ncbi:MAG: hypothetical protein GY804_00875 [Alphaproteobacteria bacterium]|nr:hypothetical protein [Alphaproteobacteria bacterium]
MKKQQNQYQNDELGLDVLKKDSMGEYPKYNNITCKVEKLRGVEFSGESALFTFEWGKNNKFTYNYVGDVIVASDYDKKNIWGGEFSSYNIRHCAEILEIFKNLKKSVVVPSQN